MTALVPAATAAGPDWSSLPGGVLQHIFGGASTWQIPGSCLAACVCRHWRAAAAGCRGIRLLYRAGHPPTDQSIIAWLGKNSPQLETLTISSDEDTSLGAVLGALAAAAAAAADDGCPLQLHTLRVLDQYSDLETTGQILGGLPHLYCLQLDLSAIWPWDEYDIQVSDTDLRLSQAASFMPSLQQATQLQELHLTGSAFLDCGVESKQLPANLKRLSWRCPAGAGRDLVFPDLSHLAQLEFLQLQRWCWDKSSTSGKWPRNLQALQLRDNLGCEDVDDLLEQQGVLTEFSSRMLRDDTLQLLKSCTKLEAYSCGSPEDLLLSNWCAAERAALQSLVNLSGLTLDGPLSLLRSHIHHTISKLHSFPALRCLSWTPTALEEASGLAGLTRLTRLDVSCHFCGGPSEQRAWTAELGSMSRLRWLSVPGVLLVAGQTWLRGLEQLQVLVLDMTSLPPGRYTPREWWQRPAPLECHELRPQPLVLSRVVAGLLGASPLPLPPRLQLLGFSNILPEEAVSRRVWRQLQRRLSSVGCEVVAGADLREVCDPVKRLAGVPMALQQALA